MNDELLLGLGLFLLLRSKSAPTTTAPAKRQAPRTDWAAALKRAGATDTIAAGLARAAQIRQLEAPSDTAAAALLSTFKNAWEQGKQHVMPSYKPTPEDQLWYATIALAKPELLKGSSGGSARTNATELLKHYPDDAPLVKAANVIAWGTETP